MPPTQPWRTFSIFISSTFADMQVERDYLKAFVFLQIEEELRKKRILLEVVDLRWGVDTASVSEADRETTVLKVCLDEIRRCKPFFIGLLGDRYGWVPPEERMKNATLGEKLILPAKGKSVTALEIEFGVLADKEQLSRSVFYFRDRLPYEEFTNDKAAKYCDDFDPELSEEDKAERKNNLNAVKMAIKTHFDEVNHPEKVKNYFAKWDKEKQRIYGLEEWGAKIAIDILEECASHASDTWNEVPKNHHEEQLALLDAFIESHTHVTIINTPGGELKVETFFGREKLLGELRQFLMSSEKEKSGIVLTGESGSGKSAVFAMVYKMVYEMTQKEKCFVLAHSAGISPDARTVLGFLQSWNKLLSDFLKLPPEEDKLTETDDLMRMPGLGDNEKKKTGIEKLQVRFSELLSMASAKTRVIMLVDALDSFEPTERAIYMTWLPGSLPANARLMVTAVTGTEKKAVEFHKYIITRSLDYFTKEEAAGLLQSLCQRQHKSLSPAIQQLILSKMRSDGLMAASSPLWLSLAVNNLVAIDADDFEKMSGQKGRGDEQIESYLQEMANGFKVQPGELFLQLIERARRIFGTEFTQTVFNAIACSRGGLRESDLEAVINTQPGNKWDGLQFANLRRWFKAQFKEQGEGKQWNLAHSILRSTLKDKMDAGEYNNLNASIATHLLSLPPEDVLRISETMYYLMQKDDKILAIGYYLVEAEQETIAASTKILAEIITLDEKGFEMVASFPMLVADHKDIFFKLLRRFAFDLNDFLAEEGNLKQRLKLLNILNETLDKSYGDEKQTEYFEYCKAALWAKSAEIHQAMGSVEIALRYFEFYSKFWEELIEANPQNESLKIGLAVSYSKLGDLHQAMGHIEKAIRYFEKDLNLTEQLYDSNTNDESFKNNLAISYSSLGDIYLEAGDTEKALNYFEKRSVLGKELYGANPQNELLKNGLAISYSKLGEIYQAMGQLGEALNNFKEAAVLFNELYEANPSNESLKKKLAISYDKLGIIYQDVGHPEIALNYFKLYCKFCIELYEANPQDTSHKFGISISYERLGGIYFAMSNIEEALNYFELHNKICLELYEANPKNESSKKSLAISYEKLGVIHQAMGHMEEALNNFDAEVRLFKELYEANPQSVQLLEGLGISYYKLAMIYKAIGNNTNGEDYFSQWENVINFLAKNLPQAAKYEQWAQIQYD